MPLLRTSGNCRARARRRGCSTVIAGAVLEGDSENLGRADHGVDRRPGIAEWRRVVVVPGCTTFRVCQL